MNVRQILAGLDGLIVHGNLTDALNDIRKYASELSFLLLDERFNHAMSVKNEDLEIVDLLEAFDSAPNRAENTIVGVLINESKTVVDEPILYLERGVDFFIQRPVGVADLKDKLAEVGKWVENPPSSVKLFRALRKQLRENRPAEMLSTVEALYNNSPGNVRVGVLYARVLEAANLEAKVIDIALDIDRRFPGSLFSKDMLVRFYEKANDPVSAANYALRLFSLNTTTDNFNRAFHWAERSAASGNVDAYVPWLKLLGELLRLEPLRTKEKRSKTFRALQTVPVAAEHVKTIYPVARKGQEDILPDVRPVLESWMKSVVASPASPARSELLGELLETLLEWEPGLPSAIETYVDLQLSRDRPREAEKRLIAARARNKFSTEFYLAFVKFALFEKNLKEASDMLHAGRRLAPSDDRWEPLAKRWKELYAASQNG